MINGATLCMLEEIRHFSGTFGWVNCTLYCRNAIESSLFKQWLKNTETGILANGAMSLTQVLIQVWIILWSCKKSLQAHNHHIFIGGYCGKHLTGGYCGKHITSGATLPLFVWGKWQCSVHFVMDQIPFSVHFLMKGLRPSGGFFTACWCSGTYLDASRSFVTHPLAIMVYKIVGSNGELASWLLDLNQLIITEEIQ